jgi:ornithine cyclodeaminase/alanine dehydrogenase-like protein (mu-crystallin family)
VTLYLGAEDIRALITQELALDAAWRSVRAEQQGEAVLPHRFDLDTANGFMRLMPAALGDVMGTKMMTVVRGTGNRYLLLLFSQENGELTAVLDAGELTRRRTAAVTVAAGQLLCPDGAEELAVIGSGFEAEGHLSAFAEVWNLRAVRVYSPSAERREAFAKRMTEQLSIEVTPVGDVAEAVDGMPAVVLATKAREPVIDGDCFAPGAAVLSIGSTRLDLRELDERAFARSAVVLVDNAAQVESESGDVSSAIAGGAISAEHLMPLSAAAADPDSIATTADRDLLTFKSVGTALQDLALAGELVAAAKAAGRGRELGELAELKAMGAPRAAKGATA